MQLPADNRSTVPQPRASAPLSTAALNELVPGYHFVEYLDGGGMGAVYKAVQKSLNRTVAVKVLPRAQSDRAGFKQRFKQEARALAQLGHPHIIAVYDFGETRDGQLYYIMEFVDGTDLFRLAREAPPRPRKILQMIAQVCEALQYAHEHGVVHRDIKPANILIDERGDVKVADFGLAKILESNTPDFTATGTTIGTPDYIAPEAMDPGAKIDHRVDIYALGVTLYELLTGHPPRGRWEPPSTCCGADKRIDGIVGRALRHDPAKRYQHVADMAQALHGLLKSGGDWKGYRRPSSRCDTSRSTARVDSKQVTRAQSVPGLASPGKGWSFRARWVWLVGIVVLGIALALTWKSLSRTSPAQVAVGRSAAQENLLRWTFARHAFVNILTQDKPGKVKGDGADIYRFEDLPKEPFTIWRVSFGSARALIRDEASLQELVRLLNDLGTVSNVALRGLEVPVPALRHLAEIKGLTSLDISDSKVATLEAVPHLTACKALRLLRIGNVARPMDPAIPAQIRAALPGCMIMQNNR